MQKIKQSINSQIQPQSQLTTNMPHNNITTLIKEIGQQQNTIHLKEEQIQSDQDEIQQKDSLWITDPQDYLQYCKNNKKIKIMDEQNPIWNNVYLKDISLHYKGPMEDKAYSKNYSYYINIRRGNTLCQIYHNNTPSQTQNNTLNPNFPSQNIQELQNNKLNNNDGKQNYDLFFCRRGMKKFYDLEPEYLSTDWKQKLTSQHLKYRNRIFQKIDTLNYNHSQIHLYSIFKQNGEHCQITFIKKLSCWLFASKNVSILVRDQKDIQKYYQKLRFYWAKLIAQQFLSMIKSLSQQQIQQLKQQLDTKTLLGQHCGLQNHQHITKYNEVQIIFYAIVQKNTQYHCLPVDYCRQFLSKYDFKMSRIKSITNLKDKNSTYQAIYTLLKQTAQGTMQQYGQGSVLYVVQQKNKNQKTIAMCKLKTCQYLIFRRLRQMLKLNVQRKSTANTFQKFQFDIKNLVSHYFSPPQSLQFYLEVGKEAFKEAQKDSNIDQNYLRYKFVEFMQKISIRKESKQNTKEELKKKVLIICLPRFTNILEKYAKNNSIPLQYMYRNIPSNIKDKQKKSCSIHILHMIPRLPQSQQELNNLEIFICQYSNNQLQQIQNKLIDCQDLTKSHLITFVKSQNKKKSLQLLNDKIILLKENLKNKNVNFTLIPKQVTNKDQQIILKLQEIRKIKSQPLKNHQNQKDKNNKRNMFIIYPMMLPGSGKSTLRQQLQNLCKDQEINFSKIEGDEIRSKFMQENLKQKGMDFDLQTQELSQTFTQVKEKTKKQIESVLIQKIQHHQKNPEQKSLLFIDKIYGPQTILTELQQISKYKCVTPIILIPQSSELKLKYFTLPFSLQYLLICLKRCIERSQHSTMTRRPQEICNIFIWFLKKYSNFSVKKTERVLEKINPFVEIMKVETVEEREVPVHTNLKRKLEECIESNRNSDKSVELIEQMYKNLQDYLKDSYAQEHKESGARRILERLRQKL